jgi:hypothetical protein
VEQLNILFLLVVVVEDRTKEAAVEAVDIVAP